MYIEKVSRCWKKMKVTQKTFLFFKMNTKSSKTNLSTIWNSILIHHQTTSVSKPNILFLFLILFLANEKPYSPLQVVHIFFETSTFDTIERDQKVTLEAQLGVVGGTMGLLTGFSILSGVEILYYMVKFFLSLRFSRMAIRQNVITGDLLFNRRN